MAPSSTPLKPSDDHKAATGADSNHLEALLDSARPFLRDDLKSVDKDLPHLVSVLHAAGAGECWHKQGSFFDHLFGVYRILKMWKVPNVVCLLGLFHSSYSNSFVNLAIFPPTPAGRDTVRALVGPAAESLIHLFCVAPRKPLNEDLLFKYSEEELVEHLRLSEISVKSIRRGGEVGDDEPWRLKLRSICPPEGVTVKHIKTGEDMPISRRVVAVFLLMTIADFADKMYNYQDVLFENHNGKLEYSGSNTITSLWPGDGKPGLWMNFVSKIAALYTLFAREEEIYLKNSGAAVAEGRDNEIELVIPPIFEGCTRVLDREDQNAARDLYWEAMYGSVELGAEKAEELLLQSVEKNPYVGEGYVVLAQIYLGKGEFAAAEESAARGLRLLLEWGSNWDKRMAWNGWVAWSRVLMSNAKDKTWPQTSWGINNLGLVRVTK